MRRLTLIMAVMVIVMFPHNSWANDGSKIFAGGMGGCLSGLAGSVLGNTIAPRPKCDDCIGIGMFLGLMGGNIIGSSLGVYSSGRSSGETGAYWATFIGSTLGTSIAMLATIATWELELQFRDDLEPPYYVFVFLISDFILPAAGATIGFNLTKEKEQKNSATINLEEGKVSFTFPNLQTQLSQIPNHRPETDYTLQLLTVRF